MTKASIPMPQKCELRPGKWYIPTYAPMYQAWLSEEICAHYPTKKAALVARKERTEGGY